MKIRGLNHRRNLRSHSFAKLVNLYADTLFVSASLGSLRYYNTQIFLLIVTVFQHSLCFTLHRGQYLKIFFFLWNRLYTVHIEWRKSLHISEYTLLSIASPRANLLITGAHQSPLICPVTDRFPHHTSTQPGTHCSLQSHAAPGLLNLISLPENQSGCNSIPKVNDVFRL